METRNFSEKELSCNCGCGEECSEGLAIHLQTVREIAGIPMPLNSTKRCRKHNKKVGGKRLSKHLKGIAADISTRKMTTEERARLIGYLVLLGFRGIGIYDTFIHADLRLVPYVWDARGKK